MARAPSIGAVPTQVSAEMQQLLIAMKRSIESGQIGSEAQRKAFLAQLDKLEASLTSELETTSAELTAEIVALDAAITAEISTKAVKSQLWEQSFLFEFPESGDYRVVVNAQLARTITGVTTRSAAGTATLTVKINSTALGGTANSVSTTEATQSHSSANALAVGDDIVFTFASATGDLEKVSVTLFGTLTLA
jgi:hypothetical protein